VIAALQAEQAGADEGLMLDPHGFVNTTNACNFFIVRRGEVWTSTGDYCMNGITRAKVIEVCRGIPVFDALRNIPVPDRHIETVASNGKPIGDGNRASRRASLVIERISRTSRMAPIKPEAAQPNGS
jgi:hypothetical protein